MIECNTATMMSAIKRQVWDDLHVNQTDMKRSDSKYYDISWNHYCYELWQHEYRYRHYSLDRFVIKSIVVKD